jgi:hypothetical protein
MKHYLLTLSVLALSAMSVLAPSAKATEWDKKTTITINRAIEIEGTILPAGSYVLRLVDSDAERYTVRIFDAAGNHVIKTVFATPTFMFEPSDGSQFKFYESKDEQPPALHTWFYPGDQTGFEFKASHRSKVMDPALGASATASTGSTN